MAVGWQLQAMFGLPFWQIATTASDANRFALRVARAVTGRPKILVFNGCYHGAVEETFVRLKDGRPINRPGLAGEFRDYTQTTRIVEFNDLDGLERELGHGDVACVITEPVLTNSCMVLPEPGFHAGLRELTRRFGSLLLIDETHTDLVGSRRLHAGAWARPRPVRARQADCRRRAGQHLGHERRHRRALRRLQPDKDGGLFRHGHHAFRQPAAVRGDARHAGRGDDGAKLRSHGTPRRAAGEGPRRGPSPATACPGTSPVSARASNSSVRPAR